MPILEMKRLEKILNITAKNTNLIRLSRDEQMQHEYTPKEEMGDAAETMEEELKPFESDE